MDVKCFSLALFLNCENLKFTDTWKSVSSFGNWYQNNLRLRSHSYRTSCHGILVSCVTNMSNALLLHSTWQFMKCFNACYLNLITILWGILGRYFHTLHLWLYCHLRLNGFYFHHKEGSYWNMLATRKRQRNVERTLDLASKTWVKIHSVLIIRCVLWGSFFKP